MGFFCLFFCSTKKEIDFHSRCDISLKTHLNENCVGSVLNVFLWNFSNDILRKLSLKLHLWVFIYSDCCESGANEKTSFKKDCRFDVQQATDQRTWEPVNPHWLFSSDCQSFCFPKSGGRHCSSLVSAWLTIVLISCFVCVLSVNLGANGLSKKVWTLCKAGYTQYR